MKHLFTKTTLIHIIAVTIFIVIFGPFFTQKGIPLGIDWSFPVYSYQLKNWFLNGIYLWMDYGNNPFGSRLSFSVALPLQAIGWALSRFINGSQYLKLIITFTFILGYFSSFFYFIKKGTNKLTTLLGSLIFIYNPSTFNFISMGWITALLSIFSLPLILILLDTFFQKKQFIYLIVAGSVFGILGFLESQSIVHFSIFIIVYYLLLKPLSVKTILKAIFAFFLIFGIAISFHLTWIIPLLLFKDPYVSASVSQNDIQRFALRFSFINIIRGWGSVYNYHFEYSFPSILTIISFLPPFTILLYLFKKIHISKTDFFFLFLFLYPFLLYLFSQHFSAYIPYTNVIRDFGRTFPYLFLSTGYFLVKINPTKITTKILITIIMAAYLWPFFNGSLYHVKSKASGVSLHNIDQRLRFHTFNSDVKKIDSLLSNDPLGKKSLVLPLGEGFISLTDKRFNGPWAAFIDYSYINSNSMRNPINTGRGNLVIQYFYSLYEKTFTSNQCPIKLSKFTDWISERGFQYLSLKKDTYVINLNKTSTDLDNCLTNSSDLELVLNLQNHKLYKITKNLIRSTFYIPTKINQTDLPSSISLPIIDVTQKNFTVNYSKNNDQVKNLSSTISSHTIAKIEYQKINPTKYLVKIRGATNIFPFVFLTSYSNQWKIYLNNLSKNKPSSGSIFKSWSKPEIKNATHLIANGYANSWLINPKTMCQNFSDLCRHNSDSTYDFDLTVEYWPQKIFYIGVIFAISITTISLGYFTIKNNHRYEKNH